MLANPLPLSFFDTYSLSIWSLGCKTLCIVMSFLVFWFICWSSSHVYFKKGPEYLIPLMEFLLYSLIPLMEFLLYSLISCNFLVLCGIVCFSFISTCLMVPASNICKLLFLRSFWVFLDFVVLFSPSFSIFHFSLLAWHIFLYYYYYYY